MVDLSLLQDMHPVLQALFAGVFTWMMTLTGASAVFIIRDFDRLIMDVMLGFAAGVMIAASYWSLLAPSIEMSLQNGQLPWFPALVGFLLGGVFLRGIDKLLPHLQYGRPSNASEGIKTPWKRSTLLVLAVTLHNIPEGLAIGVAFGAVAGGGYPYATLSGALALTIGIGIQNLPEGTVVSVPLRRDGMSSFKSFLYGQSSAIVEPVASVVGAALVILVRPLLPYALAFAAGAMIFVVVEEMIPESQRGGNAPLATMGSMVGFSLMMVLDVAFG